MKHEQIVGIGIMCAIYVTTMLGLRWVPWLTGRKRTPSWVRDMADERCTELWVDAPLNTKYFMYHNQDNDWWVVEYWMMDYGNCQCVDRELFLTRGEAVRWFIDHAREQFPE